MPRSNQTGEFNTFVGGLVTEASPLTFPENASIDEANFILNRDGSRERRLGMDREVELVPYNLTYNTAPVGDIAISAFEWKDVAGISAKSFVVCQVHDKVYIVDRVDSTLKSSSYVKQEVVLTTGVSTPSRATFASIDGRLVIAYGEPSVLVVTYDSATDSLSTSSSTIKVRDLFGVSDIIDGKDLLSPEYVNLRPTSTDPEDKHMYNLRNQGWGVPRLQWTGTLKADPVSDFEDSGGDERGLPSNADTPVLTLYANTGETDKNSERFNDEASGRQEPDRARAAMGHYIIDLLDRGASRKAAYEETTDTLTGTYINANPGASPEYVTFRTPSITLPADQSSGGVKVVSEFAGRVWYAGFSSVVVGGDEQSPNLASYVVYSQQVRHDSQITRCYQEGDPTGVESPDILDTDGGFIRLSGAYNIQAMVNIGSGLMVLAENGVWHIGGSDSGTFNANNQTVNKVSEHGTLAPSSVVVVDSTIMYWSDDAIYHIAPTQVGDYQAKEISTNIRQYYQGIEDSQKVLAQGIYDSYEKRVRWVYDNTADTAETRELVFDIVLAAFFPLVIGNVSTSQVPVVPIQVSPFNVDTVDLPVVVGADLVLSDLDSVVAQTNQTTGGFRATSYLTLVNSEDSLATSLTFSKYQNTNFKDWESVDGTGTPATAYLLTGYIGTGDYQRFKQVPYIYFHFTRTETGFIDSDEDFIVTNESSCKVRSQWDWANSEASGKWGREFQAYRYKRMYIPDKVSDSYDSGHTTVVSKNKLRGRGRVVSLLISTEDEKDMKLLGWSMTIGVNGNV
jgi:hypothetical protein